MKTFIRKTHADKKYPKYVKAYLWKGGLQSLKNNIDRKDIQHNFLITRNPLSYNLQIMVHGSLTSCYAGKAGEVIVKNGHNQFWLCDPDDFELLYKPSSKSRGKRSNQKPSQKESLAHAKEDQSTNYHKIQDEALFTRRIYYPDTVYTSDDLADQVQRVSGVPVNHTNNENVDGYVRWNRRTHQPEIILSNALSRQEAKFALAHELGHLFVDMKWYPKLQIHIKTKNDILASDQSGTTTYLSSDLKPLGERFANTFEGELIMPAADVRKIYNDLSNRVKNNFNLAKIFIASIFHVPESVALIRLNVLNMHHQLKD